MKKIVVPIDFSQESLQAFHASLVMAKTIEAEIILLHVIKIKSFPIFGGSPKPTEDIKSIEDSFNELLSKTPSEGLTITYLIKIGSVHKEIIKYAEENEAYMIIMGTHGASGFEEFWAGSNAYKVVAGASCPVITMRGTFPSSTIKKIVLPIDLSQPTREKVPFTAELAKYFGAEIYVLATCVDPMDEFKNRLNIYITQVAGFLRNQGLTAHTDLVEGENITTMTIDYAININADLISIMTEQETALINTFIGPYAQQMVNHAPLPVLSMHRTHEGSTGAAF